MASQKQTKKPSTRNRSGLKPAIARIYHRLHSSDWVLIPLGFLTVYCWYLIAPHILALPAMLTTPFPGLFFQPELLISLVALFGTLYIYKILRGKPVRPYAKVVSYIFSLVAIGVAVVLLSGYMDDLSGKSCTGFFGAKTQCINTTILRVSTIIFYQLAILWWILIVTGFVALFWKKK